MKTGVAVTVGGLAPRPLTVLRQPGHAPELLHALLDLARKENATVRAHRLQASCAARPAIDTRLLPQELVVGLPRNVKSSGSFSTTQTEHCRKFAQRLADVAAPLGLRVWLTDEHGSSRDAQAFMAASGVAPARRQGLLDAVAAALILQAHFSVAAGPQQLVRPAKGLAVAPPAAGAESQEAALKRCVAGRACV